MSTEDLVKLAQEKTVNFLSEMKDVGATDQNIYEFITWVCVGFAQGLGIPKVDLFSLIERIWANDRQN
jgi:hypothetical protein